VPSPAAGLHPETQFRPTRSSAEIKVWEALKKELPAGWSAWHSLKLRDGRATFGEGDFVLAHPERGILLLEVKGGRLEVRDGQWFQNGKPLGQSPLDQVHQFRNLLLRRFKELGRSAPSIGQAPCFPDTDFDDQPTQDDLNGIVLGAHHLRWLAASLPVVAAKAIPPRRATPPGWIELLHELWCQSWIPALSLGTRAREATARRLSLDGTQLEVLEGMFENQRALIEGGAGSGKTLLAAEAARRLAADGKTVLLLCFTSPLRKWLAERLAGSGVEVQTISGLAKRLEQESGRSPAGGALAEQEGWRHAYRVAAEVCSPRWDAVVLDEAQDLDLAAWRFVEALARGRRLWGFFDPGQGYWDDRRPDRSLFQVFYKLPRQQRCPPGIQALANRTLGLPADEAAIAAALADGTIGALVVPEGGSAAALVGQEVERLLAGGLGLGDIGIVSQRGLTAQAGDGSHRFGAHLAVRADDDDAGQRLVVDTFLRWKGLERPAIIVTGLTEEAFKRAHIRLNVALTRATVAVRLVGSAGGIGRLGLVR
jgi:hypothetical protein